jgi:hypothetical protein
MIMFKSLSLSVPVSLAFSVSAIAEQTGTTVADPLLYPPVTVLLILGMALVGYWAYEAFNTPPIPLGDGPTPPRYMTQPSQYRTAVIVFVAVCLIFYSLIAYFHREILPLVGYISPPLYKFVQSLTTDGTLSAPLVVIFSAATFFVLLKFEREWNPIALLRRVLHGWVAIPELANTIMLLARDKLVVPDEARAMTFGDPEAPFVLAGDFDKDRRSLDRQWAELCYIRLWLDRYRAQGSNNTFFNEPSFAWEKLQSDYYDVRDSVRPLKCGDTNDARVFDSAASKVEKLRIQYCRLAACFLVFKNQTRKDALRDARQFGVSMSVESARANPLRYIAIYFVAIVVAINVGVLFSAFGWDLLNHGTQAAFNQQSDLVTRWVFFALASYGMPIVAIMLLRYLGWTVDSAQPNSYVISYATIFLLALCVSAVCLALAMKFNGTSAASHMQLNELIFTRFKWALSPALVCVNVAYHMDRQIDPQLPDIGSERQWNIQQRLFACVAFAMLVTAFSTLPTLAIPASSLPPGSWPLAKLQTIILGTTFAVGFIMPLVGEFCLIKPAAQPNLPDPAKAGPPIAA